MNGGAPVWVTGNYDPQTKLAFWGTGNGGPWMGDQRPGDNLYTASTVAIDVATGQELTHGFTDEFGFASLTVTASGVVRLVVPYLNYSVLVPTTGSSIALRIAPHDLPETIP